MHGQDDTRHEQDRAAIKRHEQGAGMSREGWGRLGDSGGGGGGDATQVHD